jgi:hypothetical protein
MAVIAPGRTVMPIARPDSIATVSQNIHNGQLRAGSNSPVQQGELSVRLELSQMDIPGHDIAPTRGGYCARLDARPRGVALRARRPSRAGGRRG